MGKGAESNEGAAVQAAATERPGAKPEHVASRLSAEACYLAQETPGTGYYSRQQFAETTAQDLDRNSMKDGKLKPEIAAELIKNGAKIEEKPFLPAKGLESYFKNLSELKTTTITLDPDAKEAQGCKGKAAQKIEISISPNQNYGTDYTIKPLEVEAGKGMPSEIIVNVQEGEASRTTTVKANGAVESLLLSNGKVTMKQSFNKDLEGYAQQVDYERGGKRGSEIPSRIDTRYPDGSHIIQKYEGGVVKRINTLNADGTRVIYNYENGLPSEKLMINKRDRMNGYRAFDENGKELSALHPKSLSGRAYYEGREATGRLSNLADRIQIEVDSWKLWWNMPR